MILNIYIAKCEQRQITRKKIKVTLRKKKWGPEKIPGAKLLHLKCFSKVFVLSDYLNVVATEENFINAVEPGNLQLFQSSLHSCFLKFTDKGQAGPIRRHPPGMLTFLH